MKTVMTIDDSASVRKMVSYTLKGVGYEVVEAADGFEALDKLGETEVNVLVVDVNMPRMGGLEFVRKVREIPSHVSTPVIMLTTESAEDSIEEGKAAGASAWMVKPFSPEQLVEVVRKVLV
jgi:two-component system chemotaxis response regulator CheY